MPGNAGWHIRYTVFFKHSGGIHKNLRFRLCNLFYITVTKPLQRPRVRMADPDISSIVGKSSKMAVLFHAKSNHIFSGLFVKDIKGSKAFRIIRIIRCNHIIIFGNTDTLRTLVVRGCHILCIILFPGGWHSRNIYIIGKAESTIL